MWTHDAGTQDTHDRGLTECALSFEFRSLDIKVSQTLRTSGDFAVFLLQAQF